MFCSYGKMAEGTLSASDELPFSLAVHMSASRVVVVWLRTSDAGKRLVFPRLWLSLFQSLGKLGIVISWQEKSSGSSSVRITNLSGVTAASTCTTFSNTARALVVAHAQKESLD